MIESATLLKHLQAEVTKLEDDLRARCDADASVNAPLLAQYEAARAQKRTALTFKAWREEELTNVAVAWVLACVFVRFLEDNGLVETLHLAGPDAEGVGRARDQHELFFREHPTLTEREYLEHVFTTTAELPGMKEFFDRRHNPLWSVGPTGDAAAALVNFWRKADPETGRPVHDFSDPEWNTRFLGDLYQDLSEAARKRYALLQTPVFVEEFILDRTLTPAIETFGFRVVRMIDPTCGSGHFLLGGFSRLHRLWVQAEPAEAPAVLAQRALDQVFGVDLNPNVVAIARFRLLIAALQATGTTRLRDAFNFRINVTTGDSLLHGRRFGAFEHQGATQRTFDTEEAFRDELKHHYEVEDTAALRRILGQQYHAVVGNPPYIRVKDRALNQLYRARYSSCFRKYSLAVPFIERFFDLAIKDDGTPQHPAGFTGQITGNSFMKRELGKTLIEDFIPSWDLTHVVDTDNAYIPGHGTGTVILFGKNQLPTASTVRTVIGLKKQEPQPLVPEEGFVWRAILSQVDAPGSQTDWISVTDSPRSSFHKHPWSIGGGGASELKEEIEDSTELSLVDFVDIKRKKPVVGFGCVLGEDEILSCPRGGFPIRKLPVELRRDAIEGELIRDWTVGFENEVVFPYSAEIELRADAAILSYIWPMRTVLWARNDFGNVTYRQSGRPYWEYHQIPIERNKAVRLLCYGEIATHNHFILEQRRKVFRQTAPIIKLKADFSSEADHIQLLGVLNSSTACFWLKQVCHDKGAGGIGGGIAAEEWEHRFAFNATQVATLPIPARQPTQLPTALVEYSAALQDQSPGATLAGWSGPARSELRELLASARDLAASHRRKLIAWQEELDWQVYEAFGLVEPAVPAASADAAARQVSLPEGEAKNAVDDVALELGQRAFEIVLARRMAADDVQTTWFERHGSTPITEIPSHWPAAYRELVERRIARIESDPNIQLIEQPEYKRRWNTEPWDEQFKKAARDWLLARLEGYFFEGQRVCELKDGFDPSASGFVAAKQPALTTTSQLAGTAQTDAAFLAVAEQLMGGPGYSVPKLVRGLVEGAAVPFLPLQRYKPSGLLKRRDWEHVWELQREEDRIDALLAELHAKIEARVSERLRAGHASLFETEANLRSELDEADRAYHARFHSNIAYESSRPHHAREGFPSGREELLEHCRLMDVRKKHEDAARELRSVTAEIRKSDEVVLGLERELDAVPPKPDVPVPPKYGSGDFRKSVWWSLRGKLDVPKERWVLYPGAERGEDPSPVIAWAGWDHAQQAQALAEYYLDAKNNFGFPPEKLKLLLAGLLDLEPWLFQWHGAVDPLAGDSPANAIRAFLDAECHALGVTRADLEIIRIGA